MIQSHHHIHWLPVGMAALLALLGVWLNQLTHLPGMVDNGGFNHEPDTIVEQFKVLTFNQQGHPLHRLSAEKLTHYMDDDTTVLLMPRLTMLGADNLRTEISARRGQVSGNGEHVHLVDDVHITRHSAAAPVSLASSYLWVTPDAGTLRSDKPVTLRQGNILITAGGLLADNENKQIILTGKVRASYEKNH